MKFLFLLTYYSPHWTGLSDYARRLAEGLQSRGHDVTVVTTKHDEGLKSEEFIGGVRVLRSPVWFRLSRTLISPRLLVFFVKEIRSTDAVVIYLPFAEVLLASIVSSFFGKKTYLVHNGDLVLRQGLLNKFLESFYFITTLLSVKLAKKIIAQTRDYAASSRLLSKARDKLSVIVPLYEKRSMSSKTKLKLRKKLPAKFTHLVGFAGRFVHEKGFDILLSAIPQVLKRFPRVIFAYAGETNMVYENFYNENKYLIQKNRDHLIILGRLSPDEMAAFYCLCDAFVISSRSDCFPSVEVEALLSGVPVVVSDIPGARWPVKTSGMGEIVPSKNSHALAEGITKVLKNRDRYIRPHIIKRVQELFDYEKTLRTYEALFTKGN